MDTPGTIAKPWTILVVDDEPEVGKLVSSMLTRMGYQVLLAESGEQALKIFQKHPDIHMLLTDVVAPGMSGPMLADQLIELQPELRVLFMSGYDSTQVVQHYVVERGFALIPKPFTSQALTRKVAEVLGVMNLPSASVG